MDARLVSVPLDQTCNVGRRERQRERRLLKGFTAGLFETVVEDMMNSSQSINNHAVDTANRMTSVKQRIAKQNWNDIVSKIKENQNHIGFSRGDSLRHSIDTLRREVVLEEQEVRSIQGLEDRSASEHLKGLARFIAVAKSLHIRDIPDGVYGPLESVSEEYCQAYESPQKSRNHSENETMTSPPVPLDVNSIVLQPSATESQTPKISYGTCKVEIVPVLETTEQAENSETPQNTSPTVIATPETPPRRNKYAIKPLDRKPQGGWM
ncbi:hypothetical protein GQR58_011171 [Nymphon striatum]|nr:hypothetical protein GQR58_011171 [Nymphon striatum]